MLKKILFLLAIAWPFVGSAQVNITVQLPPAGPVQKSQLWNLVLLNNTERSEEVSLRFDMQDAASGQTVLSGISGTFSIGKGIKLIGQQEVQPLTYNYSAPDFSRDNIPMGSYIICYQVISVDKSQMLGDECIRVNIDPLSPPMLNTPYDKEELLTPYPQFTWIPPAPFDMFSRLNYDLVVAEVQPGQSPQDAVEYNVPIYNRSNLTQTSEHYPPSFSKLDTGKLYAWQVIARNGENYAAKTEVWTFKVKPTIAAPTETSAPIYIYLGTAASQNNAIVVRGSKLYLKYYCYEAEHTSGVRLTTTAGKVLKTWSPVLIYGDNYLIIDLPNRLKVGQNYIIELETAGGQKNSANFILANTKASDLK